MSRCRKPFCGVLLCLLVLGASCSDGPRPVSREWATMGTFAAVSVPAADAAELDRCVRDAADVFSGINDALTVYTKTSELSAVNRNAGYGAVAVSASSGEAVAAALKYAELSEGYFDPTIAPLVRLWGFNNGTAPASLPSAGDIRALLANTGFENVRLEPPVESDPNGNWQVELMRTGMSLDLGGVAKGYAVDVCFEQLRDSGANNVMVNLGGNIRCCGEARPGRSWRIGVRNPFNESRMLGVLAVPDGWAVATSGNYERYVVIDGKRYTHIINPRTGYPVAGMAGVTVVAATAVEADAMSTALFVMGCDEAAGILPNMPDCEALFVEDEQPTAVRITPGFGQWFTPEDEFVDSVRIIPN